MTTHSGSDTTDSMPSASAEDIAAAGARLIPLELLRTIIADAIRAPSGDNCQPWKFSWDGETLRLVNVIERGRCFYNVDELASYLVFGALVEGLSISASAYSYKTETEFVGADDAIARVRFRKSNVVRDELSTALAQRHTNRYPFKTRAIAPESMAALNTELTRASNVRGIWRTSFAERFTLARMAFTADRIFWQSAALHKDLFHWVDLTHDAEHSQEGLTLDVLGLTAMTRRVFPHLARWRTVSSLNRIGLSRALGMQSLQLMMRSGGVLVLCVPAAERKHLFDAGRTLQRLWCRANQLGLAVQPMTGWLFMLMNQAIHGASEVSEKHAAKFDSIKRLWGSIEPDDGPMLPCMCVRVGYPLQTVARSGRLPLDRILEIK